MIFCKKLKVMDIWLILKKCRKICDSLNDIDENDNNENISGEEGEILQQIKANFCKREYMDVFMVSRKHLAVYFKYYVPSRVLCYFDLFSNNGQLLNIISGRSSIMDLELTRRRLLRKKDSRADLISFPTDQPLEISCIGAGAGSEQLALIQVISREMQKQVRRVTDIQRESLTYSEFCDQLKGIQFDSYILHIMDIADWQLVQTHINNHCNLVNKNIKVDFNQVDILEVGNNPKVQSFLKRSHLITFMFVLNELFAVSKKKTVALLQWIMDNLPVGTFLLFVESAGSFSDLSVGTKELKVFQLLDRIGKLERVSGEDSKWYRFANSLQNMENKDSFDLQNMRYFYRLYKKIV